MALQLGWVQFLAFLAGSNRKMTPNCLRNPSSHIQSIDLVDGRFFALLELNDLRPCAPYKARPTIAVVGCFSGAMATGQPVRSYELIIGRRSSTVSACLPWAMKSNWLVLHGSIP